MNTFRRKAAHQVRSEANDLAHQRPHLRHLSNGDEQKFRHREAIAQCHDPKHAEQYEPTPKSITTDDLKDKPSYLMSFTKGLPHNIHTGLAQNPDDFQSFVRAIDSGDPRDFRDTPLGSYKNLGNVSPCTSPAWKSSKAKEIKAKVRAWESQSAGLSYDLEGPDAQAVTMPPAPKLGSPELTGEMGEIYIQALLRDLPFNTLTVGATYKSKRSSLKIIEDDYTNVAAHVQRLANLDWHNPNADLGKLSDDACARRRSDALTTDNAFRGITNGDVVGPYISQFLLMGNKGIGKDKHEEGINNNEGKINYGAIQIDQRVRTALKGKDYMTNWNEWFDVQNAADLRGIEEYDNTQKRRFIYTPRDLATYVHLDALYEAYLNACLIMLSHSIPFDPGIPFQQADDRDHQQGFAHFGGPHILSLVTEVATRALKAVRYQKYNVHRRCRPEVLAARLTKVDLLAGMAPELVDMAKDLGKDGNTIDPNSILSAIRDHNEAANNSAEPEDRNSSNKDTNFLLPMAFYEGSPMHPAYGAGHATVAGACVTILKAFFDHKHPFRPDTKTSTKAYVSIKDGKQLALVNVYNAKGQLSDLTVEGELNKLASNISIGRNWAGVHYFSDYYESLLMGEQIALGILEEQKLTYSENFSMNVPLFDGREIRI